MKLGEGGGKRETFLFPASLFSHPLDLFLRCRTSVQNYSVRLFILIKRDYYLNGIMWHHVAHGGYTVDSEFVPAQLV